MADWTDWHPDQEPTLLLDEVLTLVESRGYYVPRTTVRYWQTQGLLPHPVKRWRGDGSYALYPPIAVDYIIQIKKWQTPTTLTEIAERLRTFRIGKPENGSMSVSVEDPE